jgi:plastocyanin
MKIKRRLSIVALIIVTMISAFVFPVDKTISQSNKQPYQRVGNEATIRGTVTLVGKHPANRRIDESADPVCASLDPAARTESVIGRHGRLANVFVYIKSGKALDDFSFAARRANVVLDQRGCRFVPHVLGMQTSQTLEVLNSDPTTHNVHKTPKMNPDWNQSQPAGSGPLVSSFTHSEVMVPIKCNQHPWMKAYVGVLSHPFFAVSDRDGSFRIEGLPPGDYTLAAWHEEFGDKTLPLMIAPASQQVVNLSFRSTDRRTWR